MTLSGEEPSHSSAAGKQLEHPADQFAQVGRCASTGKEITICYNTFGSRSDPCMLLVMGLNCQGVFWDFRFCELLAAAGFYVIRYDNRDVGLSTHLDELPAPFVARMALPAWLSWGEGRPPYTLEDMAQDGLGLLTALGIEQAHVVGTSMGGMIAQCVALRAPARVRSLCLMSTFSGPRHMRWPQARIVLNMLDYPRSPAREDVVAFQERFFRPIAGRLPFPVKEFRKSVAWVYDRCPYQEGRGRQLAAIMRSADRSEALTRLNASRATSVAPLGSGLRLLTRELTQRWWTESAPPGEATAAKVTPEPLVEAAKQHYIPVVVIHGGSDAIIPHANGERLAALIPGAKLVIFPKMGHYFPPLMFRPLTDEIILNARSSSRYA